MIESLCEKVTSKQAALRLIHDAMLTLNSAYWQEGCTMLEVDKMTQREKEEVQRQVSNELLRYEKKYAKSIWG